jgi:hypothetical protein
MYVGPQVGSLVDLQLEPRRCQEHRVAVPGFASESPYDVLAGTWATSRLVRTAIK